MNGVLVSVICTVYNHERYLNQTLAGIVNQETNFVFEVLVHDDASTDLSAQIIKEYEDKYPNLIKPIYQSENQHSKGKIILKEYMLTRAAGKYMAICEGDDYWIDKHKLQKQVDYMENHPSCTFCFTNGVIENVQTGKKKRFIPYKKSDLSNLKDDGIYNVVEISKLSFLPTCSFLYPRSNFEKYPNYFWEKCFGGDRKTSLYATALGYAYFLNDETCCYHYAVTDSAMTKYRTKFETAKIEMTFANLYNRIDEFTEYKYHIYFEEKKLSYLKWVYCLQGKEKLLTIGEMNQVISSFTITDKIKKLLLSLMSDKTFNKIRAIKRKVC